MSSSSGSKSLDPYDSTTEEFQKAVRLSEEFFIGSDATKHDTFAIFLLRSARIDESLALNTGQYEWKSMERKLRKIEKAIKTLNELFPKVPFRFEMDTTLDLSEFGCPARYLTIRQIAEEMQEQLFDAKNGFGQTKFEFAVERAKPRTRKDDAGQIGRRNARVVMYLNERWEENGREVDQNWINTARTANLTPYLKYVHRGLQVAGIIKCADGEFDMPHLTAIFRHYRDYRNDFRIFSHTVN